MWSEIDFDNKCIHINRTFLSIWVWKEDALPNDYAAISAQAKETKELQE